MSVIFSGIFDTKLSVIDRNNQDTLIGHYSIYADTPHAGTGNTIDGWQWDDRHWPSEQNDYPTTIAVLTDPDLSEVDSEDFQSGIGDNKDLSVEEIEELLASGNFTHWAPLVNHGWFYNFEQENYLFSDGQRIEYLQNQNITTSGFNFIDLTEHSKPGTPILARTYEWDDDVEEYTVWKDYRKKVYFTGYRDQTSLVRQDTFDEDTQTILFENVDTEDPEFIVLYSGTYFNYFDKERLIFNGDYTNEIGQVVLSGLDLLELEEVGESDGTDNQQFHTSLSPIDETQALQIFSYTSLSTYQQWTVVSGITHTGYQVEIDSNLGTLTFAGGDDNKPEDGSTIVVRYTPTVEIAYEVDNTTDKYLALETTANANPIRHFVERGFVLIKNNEPQPYSISLEADLDLISLNVYGPVYIGNNFTKIFATVKDRKGKVLEGIDVTFELLDNPLIGRLTNNGNTITASTNENGIATTYYNTPASINDVGEFITSENFELSSGDSILITSGIKVTDEQNSVFIYKVWTDDAILGIPLGDQELLDAGNITTQLMEYYEDELFRPDGIYGVLGINSGIDSSYNGITSSGSPAWEQRRRLLTGLLTPTNYNRNLRNGRKQIVSIYDNEALNPHVSTHGAFVPLQPTAVEQLDTSVHNRVIYSGITLTTPGTGDLDAYFMISPSEVLVRAKTYVESLGRTIFSNTIKLQLDIAPYQNGTVFIDDINSVPSGIVPYILTSLDNDRILPLGFRLPSTGNTLASALNAVTYLDINKPAVLNQGFYVTTSGNDL